MLPVGGPPMNPEIGTMMVYPVHGMAEVIAHEERAVNGETLTYIVFKVEGEIPADELTICALQNRLEELGVRHVMSLQDATDVLEVLSVRSVHLPSSWSRRFKNHQAKLRTGDAFERAEVVRNLALRLREKPLAFAETAMYKQARSGLIAELAVTWGITQHAAAERVTDALDN